MLLKEAFPVSKKEKTAIASVHHTQSCHLGSWKGFPEEENFWKCFCELPYLSTSTTVPEFI